MMANDPTFVHRPAYADAGGGVAKVLHHRILATFSWNKIPICIMWREKQIWDQSPITCSPIFWSQLTFVRVCHLHRGTHSRWLIWNKECFSSELNQGGRFSKIYQLWIKIWQKFLWEGGDHPRTVLGKSGPFCPVLTLNFEQNFFPLIATLGAFLAQTTNFITFPTGHIQVNKKFRLLSAPILKMVRRFNNCDWVRKWKS